MYTIEMNNRKITCDRETLFSLIRIPADYVTAIYKLAIGCTIEVSHWRITRI